MTKYRKGDKVTIPGVIASDSVDDRRVKVDTDLSEYNWIDTNKLLSHERSINKDDIVKVKNWTGEYDVRYVEGEDVLVKGELGSFYVVKLSDVVLT